MAKGESMSAARSNLQGAYAWRLSANARPGDSAPRPVLTSTVQRQRQCQDQQQDQKQPSPQLMTPSSGRTSLAGRSASATAVLLILCSTWFTAPSANVHAGGCCPLGQASQQARYPPGGPTPLCFSLPLWRASEKHGEPVGYGWHPAGDSSAPDVRHAVVCRSGRGSCCM